MVMKLSELQKGEMSLHVSNFRPLSIFVCQIQDIKVGIQAHKTPIFSYFYHFEVLCQVVFSFSDTNTYPFIFFFTVVDHIERYKKTVEQKILPHAVAGKLAPKMLHFRLFKFGLFQTSLKM